MSKQKQLIFIYKCGHEKALLISHPEEFGADENGVVDSRNEYCEICEEIYVTRWSNGVPKWKFHPGKTKPKTDWPALWARTEPKLKTE